MKEITNQQILVCIIRKLLNDDKKTPMIDYVHSCFDSTKYITTNLSGRIFEIINSITDEKDGKIHLVKLKE